MARGFGWKVLAACLLVMLPLALILPLILNTHRAQERREAADNVQRAFIAALATRPGLVADRPRLAETLKDLSSFSGAAVKFAVPGKTTDAASPAGELRFSNELKKEAWVYGFPVSDGGKELGVLHVTLAEKGDGREPVYWLYYALALIFSVSAAVAVSVYITGAFTRRLKGLSGYLGGLSSRFLETRTEEDFGDELERVSARARSLADRIIETMDMLRDEKEKVRGIIEQFDDGVVLFDAQTRIVLFNGAFTRMFGIPHGPDCLGKPVRETVRNPHLLEAIDLFTATQSTVRREIAIVGAATRHIAAVVSPFLSGSAQKRALLILHDITPQKQTEEMRVDFVANASHELKTPLTAIRGFVETLADGAVDDPKAARHFLGIIQKHTERLSLLVDDLLTLSNVELGKVQPQITTVPLESTIKNVEHTFSQSAASAAVALAHSIEPGLETVEADRDRLLQILLNLVDNAIKYTPVGGRVDIACRKLSVNPQNVPAFGYPSLDGNPLLPETGEGWERSYVEFSVSDTGEGIPPQALPRLMERFYRVDNARSRERGGTGLGLSIVKHLVIAHRGSIRVESAVGKGTTVRFVIPARQKRN